MGRAPRFALVLGAAFGVAVAVAPSASADAPAASAEPRFNLGLPADFARHASGERRHDAKPPTPSATVTRARTGHVAAGAGLLEHLPFAIEGRDAVVRPTGWSVRLGHGATPSQGVGRADLSATRSVTGADVGGHRGNVHLGADGAGPTVGELFPSYNGLGHRRRARLDLQLEDDGATTAGASLTLAGDADAAVRHRGRWQGLDASARAAVVSNAGAAGRTFRLETSAALRAPVAGWSVSVAAMGARRPDDLRAPAAFYTKLAREFDGAGPIATAWAVEAAYARDVADRGDRAWLAGAAMLKRFDGLGRLHVRYRYQSLAGEAGREGQAHAVVLGAKLKL